MTLATRLAEILALCDRLEREPATADQIRAAELALGLAERWPPSQLALPLAG